MRDILDQVGLKALVFEMNEPTAAYSQKWGLEKLPYVKRLSLLAVHA